ncbi:MAG: type II secretion system major pseudopilin GspG [Desulfurivibrionaceae bacterium]
MEKRNLKKQGGFSLLEMLIVIIILLLLGSLVGPKFFGREDKARQKAVRTQIEKFMVALEAFRLDVGRYPTQQEGLTALVTNSGIEKWEGAYLKKAVPNDPWGNPYHYRNPGEHGVVDIYSYGQDNQPDGEKENADLGSWE